MTKKGTDRELSEIIPESKTDRDPILWEGVQVQMQVPREPAIDPNQGFHLEILPREALYQDWREAPSAIVIEEGYYALAGARLISASGLSPDLWANIHWNSAHGFFHGANVFGRRPTSKTGWAKPVHIERYKAIDPKVLEKMVAHFKPFTERYFVYWQNTQSDIRLFRDGLNPLDPLSAEFQKVVEDPARLGHESAAWANDRFSVVIIDNPHLTGFHLVVHPRPSYWSERGNFFKAWQTREAIRGDYTFIEGFLESLTILKIIQDILKESGLSFHNPEIHYSGNWTKDLLSLEEGGRFDSALYQEAQAASQPERALRRQKRQYEPGAVSEFRSAMHGHLYATLEPDSYVKLPDRPMVEVPEQWKTIEPMDREKVAKVKELIQSRLTSAIESVL